MFLYIYVNKSSHIILPTVSNHINMTILYDLKEFHFIGLYWSQLCRYTFIHLVYVILCIFDGLPAIVGNKFIALQVFGYPKAILAIIHMQDGRKCKTVRPSEVIQKCAIFALQTQKIFIVVSRRTLVYVQYQHLIGVAIVIESTFR